MTSTLLIAQATPAKYASATGLVLDHGFIALNRSAVAALYSSPIAAETRIALDAAGIAHHSISADTFNDGLRHAAAQLIALRAKITDTASRYRAGWPNDGSDDASKRLGQELTQLLRESAR